MIQNKFDGKFEELLKFDSALSFVDFLIKEIPGFWDEAIHDGG